MKKIIVTGGSGFLGKHLLRALTQAGYQVKNIDLVDNNEFETVIADVRDSAKMMIEIKDADLVFHLASLIQAGESVEKPQLYTDYNIDGTISVLEAMRVNGIKNFVFSSSAAVYGEPLHIPIKEDDRTIPINPYGMTKLAMEGLLSSYVKAFGFTGVALRYFNLYGPGEDHQPETHAIPRFVKQIFEGSEVTIYGQGQHQRDYIYISDIVDAHLKTIELCLKQPQKYHYFNLSTQVPTTVLQLVQTIEQVMGKKAQLKYLPERPGDPLQLYADASKSKQILGWQSQVSLEAGMKQTVEYFINRWQETK